MKSRYCYSLLLRVNGFKHQTALRLHRHHLLLFPSVATSSASVPQGPGLGPIPMSQFGTISRQISRHNSSTTSSASMVSATGTYRRAPSVSSQQPHVNGGPAYTQNSGSV